MLAPVVLSLVLAFTPTASAEHIFATTMDPPTFPSAENRIVILGPCLEGITDLSYPADTGFFVAHGWFFELWSEAPPIEKQAFMSRATSFELWVDGELQKSALHAPVVNFPDFGQVKFKFFVIEDHDGLRGTHSFVGRWFFDASFIGGELREPVLDIECDMTVTFT